MNKPVAVLMLILECVLFRDYSSIYIICYSRIGFVVLFKKRQRQKGQKGQEGQKGQKKIKGTKKTKKTKKTGTKRTKWTKRQG